MSHDIWLCLVKVINDSPKHFGLNCVTYFLTDTDKFVQLTMPSFLLKSVSCLWVLLQSYIPWETFFNPDDEWKILASLRISWDINIYKYFEFPASQSSAVYHTLVLFLWLCLPTTLIFNTVFFACFSCFFFLACWYFLRPSVFCCK